MRDPRDPPGVARFRRIANRDTGRREVFWLAHWVDEHGASGKRKFSVLCHGERKAKQLAIAERERQLKRVCAIKAAVTSAMSPAQAKKTSNHRLEARSRMRRAFTSPLR